MLTLSLRNQTLTGILPFGAARDGVIIFHVVTGDRPPRPQDTRWLTDPIWNMIATCWSEKREQRWDVRAVYNQFSVASIQEAAENPRGAQCLPHNRRHKLKDLSLVGIRSNTAVGTGTSFVSCLDVV